MGNSSSMLTQYDIEEVQNRCQKLFSQQEIVSLYERFFQLDLNAKGFISADKLLSVPEFAMNPLSQRLLKMDGLNFKDFVAFLSAFSAKASVQQKIKLIFKVYDSDGNGKVSFNDILEVLRNLSGSFISDNQREFAKEEGLKKAVKNVNGIWIDGKKIYVGVAKYKKQRPCQVDSRNFIREEDMLYKGGYWRIKIDIESFNRLRDERSYKDALVSNVGMREDRVSKENRVGIPRKKSGLRNLWEMHIPSDESDWVKRSLAGIIKTHFDLDLVMKGLASDGIKVKLVKWGYARNSCILTFASVEELKEACWSSVIMLECPVSGKTCFKMGEVICIQDSTARREDMAVARALLRVASLLIYRKQLHLDLNSAVDGGGAYREVATSEEGDDRYSGGVGRSDILVRILEVDEGQPSGERVSELREENLNLRGEYLGLGLRNNICYSSEKAQSDDFNRSSGDIPSDLQQTDLEKSNLQILIPAKLDSILKRNTGESNVRIQSHCRGLSKNNNSEGIEEEVELDKEFRSIEETEVERELVPVQKERPVGRWKRGSVSRVYRRTRVRMVWHNPSRKDEGLQIRELVVQNRNILIPSLSRQSYLNSLVEGANSINEEFDVPQISEVGIAQYSRNVEEFSTGYIPGSMPGRVSRSRRRLLIREALDVVSFPKVYSSTFSLFLEEALATWEVTKYWGYLLKRKKAFLDKIINFEEGMAESREWGNSGD
ncbi:Calcium-binding EF-hand family protein isoform 2 [Hibiscus syriacus]|uniref:Calcium-binding EF-hand family protein isoform 2 n=1 Tax=Hibiscus syriacus TaxID=106335 RepID=A0A6A3BMY7_HIBSY|nr:Calcium-binding EF-hand family protein isoform 2 [Hibiscus syriacus]